LNTAISDHNGPNKAAIILKRFLMLRSIGNGTTLWVVHGETALCSAVEPLILLD
jgi:hypothetical protein